MTDQEAKVDRETEQTVDLLVTLRDVNDDRQFEVVVPHKTIGGSAWSIASDIIAITSAATELMLGRESDGDGSLKAAAAAGDIVPDLIRKNGPTVEIAVAGTYPFSEDRYEEIFQAVDADCATLQGLFSMADNRFELGLHNTSLLEDYERYMMDCYLDVVPTTEAKFNQAFVDLVLALRQDGDVSAALESAEQVLLLKGMIDPPPASPTI